MLQNLRVNTLTADVRWVRTSAAPQLACAPVGQLNVQVVRQMLQNWKAKTCSRAP